jgi:two-component system KDP operon response regulator KdpE
LAKILLIDDDPQFRRTLRIALSVRGHEVGEAANGLEALKQLRTSTPDLVLMDWQMPGMNGGGTCQAIRAVSEVPIIVVSAFDRTKEALAYRLSGSLTKPVEIDTLLASMDSALHVSHPP